MEQMPLSAADVAAVTGNNRGYDGYGMDGAGAWFWIIIILFAFWGNNGWGNNGNGVQENIDSRFLERDIFSTNQNVSTTGAGINSNICDTKYDLGTALLENRYTNQLGLQNLGTQMQNCCCETNRNIDSVRYDNLLTAKDAQMQLAECCCRLEAGNLANTQKILDKLCDNEINQLRTDLQSAQLQISQLSQTSNIVNTLRPTPIPAYITCSPYQSAYNNGFGFGCGCNNCGC